MAWITPKLDWTTASYYNFADLNRVENNCKAVRDLMVSQGISVTIQSVVTDRTKESIPTKGDFLRVESNLEALRQNYTPIGWVSRALPWAADSPFAAKDALRWENNLNLLWLHYS